jgi:hypothetical protein
LKKHLILVVLAVAPLAGGCSYTEHTTATTPAPAPAQVVVPSQSVRQTNYNDSVTGKPLSSERVVTTRY